MLPFSCTYLWACRPKSSMCISQACGQLLSVPACMPFLLLHCACVCLTALSEACVLICKPPLACPCASLKSQLKPCSAEILEASGSSHLVITHKSMARAFLCTALALPPTSFRSLDMNNGGVSIFRSAAQLLSTRCKLRLWCEPDAVCHDCAYLHCILLTAPLQNAVRCVLPLSLYLPMHAAYVRMTNVLSDACSHD